MLQRAWHAAGGEVIVRSAGVRGGGFTVPPATSEAANLAGVDLADHQSRRLTAELIDTDGADLVVGMTRSHLADTIALVPSCFPRAFTLRELVRRTEALDQPPADWDAWLAAIGEGREPRDLVLPDLADDLPDPIGHPVAAHILMVQEVMQMSQRLAEVTPWP